MITEVCVCLTDFYSLINSQNCIFMKTKLFYVASFLLVFFTSCSVDQDSDEISVQEKKMAVIDLFNVFSEKTINSPSYFELKQTIQSKSSSDLTEEELEKLEREFLNKQSAEFIELYNYVVDLDLEEDEIRDIIFEYLSTIRENSGKKYNNVNQKDSDECSFSSLNDAGGSLLAFIIAKVLCETHSER